MIPIYKPRITDREKRYVNECLDSSWISSRGSFIERFEHAFAERIGVGFATSVCNGTAALHLALLALGVGQGDEVVVPSLTYVASANAIVMAGATPVFADSLKHDWQVDPEDVRRRITPKTKAIMAVHLYGSPSDLDQLLEICRVHNLLLIEDCAEAFGTLYKGRHVGVFGHVATFSFFGNKTVTTGEGGMVVTRDKDVAVRASQLRNQGVSAETEYWHDVLGYNYRMTNICAAIGLAQLEGAERILADKRAIAFRYRDWLKGLPLSFHSEQPNTLHSFWMCSIAVIDGSVRSRLRDHLKSAGIETRPLFYPCHVLPHYATGQNLPVAQALSTSGINLPSFPDLTYDEVLSVCELIKEFYCRD